MSVPGGAGREAADRAVLDDLLAHLDPAVAVDDYESQAVQAAWASVYGGVVAQVQPRIRIELKGLRELDAMQAGVVAHAVQEAAAIVGAHLNSRAEVHRVLGGDVARVRLVQESQHGGVIWLRVAAQDDQTLAIPAPRVGERAVRELLSYLPSEIGDHGSVEGALGAEQPVRRAVDTLAAMSLGIHSEVDFQLFGDQGEATTSVLTQDTADYLHRRLDTGHEVVESERRRARVDGMRNSRRVCYLILPGGRELAVSISNDQRVQVQSLIGRMVWADVTSRRVESPAGRRTHKAYRLVSLSDDDAQLPT